MHNRKVFNYREATRFFHQRKEMYNCIRSLQWVFPWIQEIFSDLYAAHIPYLRYLLILSFVMLIIYKSQLATWWFFLSLKLGRVRTSMYKLGSIAYTMQLKALFTLRLLPSALVKQVHSCIELQFLALNFMYNGITMLYLFLKTLSKLCLTNLVHVRRSAVWRFISPSASLRSTGTKRVHCFCVPSKSVILEKTIILTIKV